MTVGYGMRSSEGRGNAPSPLVPRTIAGPACRKFLKKVRVAEAPSHSKSLRKAAAAIWDYTLEKWGAEQADVYVRGLLAPPS